MKTSKQPLLFSEIAENTDSSVLTTNHKFNKWFSRYSPDAPKKPKFGGMVRKSVIFVTGTSGAGKTTTMVNIMNWTPDITSSLYARECDLDEIKDQISPFEVTHKNAHFSDATIYPTFSDYMNHLKKDQPEMVFVDSLQAIATAEHRSMKMTKDDAAEYIRQELTNYIKERKGILFLIGHNTKEGEFAGKNTNMQMVDAHMVLEYDKKSGVRKIYWGQKNRKGPMTMMYYEIHDGQIEYFNPDEYQLPVLEEELVESKIKVPSVISPKVMFKLFMEQFKSEPNFESFKVSAEKILKTNIESYKKTYKNEFAEAHAYFATIQSVYTLAVSNKLISIK